MGQATSRWAQRRGADTLRELIPQKTSGHDVPAPNFRRETLLAALSNVAAAINKKHGNVTIIAVGGAVNTIYLQSREATHDVDFFNDNLTPEDFEHLVEGMGIRSASKKDKTLTSDWLNNRTIFFIPKDKQQTLSQQAYEQREVVFEEPGLTVLAAPWEYAFCCKIDRLSGAGLHTPESYDASDVVEYLHRYLT
ncbi:hypothetical protein IWW34DRAFT_268271 [Fusarium oxysporum f. sp. albedinis]|jgi:hypothetical protein|nr:hypothetical protein IWW34DRAFT_268271 [Fusarium oxysporum f. sp. albedinis]KAK2479569.1 hypothetical protein H9L39_08943 [Fusarium oxysporum f. sp. albedinis]